MHLDPAMLSHTVVSEHFATGERIIIATSQITMIGHHTRWIPLILICFHALHMFFVAGIDVLGNARI